MINQQLLDFITQQLSGGFSREAITNSLKSNGWKEGDIDEVFQAINSNKENALNTPARPGNLYNANYSRSGKAFGIVVIVLILLLGGVAAYSLKNDKPITTDQDINNSLPDIDQVGETTPETESLGIEQPKMEESSKNIAIPNSTNINQDKCNISKESLPLAGTTIYISSDTSSASINGFKFSQINFLKNEIRMTVSHVSTDKVETVNFSLNKPVIVLCQTMKLIGIKEKEHTIDGEILKYLSAEIQING